MRIATVQAGQSHFVKGNPGLEANFTALAAQARLAASNQADLVVFPEYAISGWPYPAESAINGLAEPFARHLDRKYGGAWAFFGCQDPGGYLDRARAQGVNVIRVALEGRPYWKELSCEGINDRTYRAPGEEFLCPMVETFRTLPFWRMNPNQTGAMVSDPTLVQAALATAGRDCVIVSCCTRETGKAVPGTNRTLRLPDGAYRLSVLKPADGATVESRTHVSKGLGQAATFALPPFTDDLAVRLERTQSAGQARPLEEALRP